MSRLASKVTCTIDLDVTGLHRGFLQIPHSVHRSAYGQILVPIISIKNGRGPTILLTAGVHGDEYEGQVVLSELAKTLAPEAVTGQLILLPAVNSPAAQAGLRVSPIDDLNLNRCFPGDANGSPTKMLADFLEQSVFPRVDYHIDLHSGGTSLEYLPLALLRSNAIKTHGDVVLTLAKTFAAPITLVTESPTGYADETIAGAAERNAVPCLMSELGGGGRISRAALKLGVDGIERALAHLSIIENSKSKNTVPTTQFMRLDKPQYYCYAENTGVFEPLFDLGDRVIKGQEAGRIHYPEKPWKASKTINFDEDGIAVCKRALGRIMPGDCLYHLAGYIESESELLGLW